MALPRKKAPCAGSGAQLFERQVLLDQNDRARGLHGHFDGHGGHEALHLQAMGGGPHHDHADVVALCIATLQSCPIPPTLPPVSRPAPQIPLSGICNGP